MTQLVFETTPLLLHAEGTDGSTLIVDEAGKSLSVTGGVTISTTQSKIGAASIYSNGTAGSYISVDNPSACQIGNEDFTLEAWLRVSTIAASQVVLQGGLYSPGTMGLKMSLYNGAVYCEHGNQSCITSSGLMTANTWTHVAYVRSGNNYYVFIDGVQRATSSGTPVTPPWDSLKIGAMWMYGSAQSNFSGNIDELRLSRGALYSGTFTPPTAALSVGPTFNIVSKAASTVGGMAGGGVLPPIPGWSSVSAVSPEDCMPYGVPSVLYDFKGRGVITGTVKEKSTPSNVPLRRLVRLHREPDGLFIRATWSDPVTGAYSFIGVRPDHKFFVTSFDYSGTYRAVIADNITPTLL